MFRFFTSPAAATNALASGAIDVLAYPPRDASLLEGRFEIISGYPGAATMLLRVSTKTAPFDNKTVRQALQHAINRDRIVKEVLYDFGGPALLPFGPNSPARDSDGARTGRLRPREVEGAPRRGAGPRRWQGDGQRVGIR